LNEKLMRRRLWPHSLVGQLLLGAGIALLIAQAVSFALMVESQRQQRGAIIAAASAAAIAESVDRLALGLPLRGAARRRFADNGQDMSGFAGRRRGEIVRRERAMRRDAVVAATARIPAGAELQDGLARRIQALLAEAEVDVDAVRAAYMPIPEFFRRDGRRVGRMLAVAAHLPDGRWLTIRAPVADPVGRVQAQLIGQTLILFVLLMLPLLWIARRAAKPLAVLTKAARDAAPGQMPVIAETGPADVRDITRAFNDLSARVRAMLVDKDRTLGAIGHDLRTPLASLRVRIERIDDVPLREAMSATIDEMASMLDDIVALARAGQPHELPVMTDLAALLAGLVDDYVEMGKPVRLAESGIVASALVRPAAIRRALRNLIDNALTYGGDAELGLERQAEWLCLSVSDRGPGVPEARLAEMLEPFTRAEESRNRATGGAGLGLALAKAIAEGEGGTLSLRNRPGGGLVAIIALIA
jgi:signal transduction histidine kinase